MTDWDVIVIGAGPAGSSVATYLAREGHRVLLLERERLPREHIGESLLPGVLPYLDALGVREQVEREGFVRKEGQTFIWGRDRTPWELDFRELDAHPYAFFVERARFDEILARRAEACGAELREGCAVREIMFDEGRAVGVVARIDGRDVTLGARFVVDASGQSALVARGAKLRRLVRGLKSVALWSYFRGARRLPGHRAAHIFTVSVPAGWVWCIPLREDRMSVGLVTSAPRPGAAGRAAADQRYLDTLKATRPVWDLLEGAERVAPISRARDWSYRATRTSGPGIFLCGDAACFVDPILSTGVHLAMTSARWAAACIHSALREPRHEPILRAFYEDQYRTTFRELLAQVQAFYRFEGRRDAVYWQSKRILGMGHGVPENLAFLFVTAGLLRNAATPSPNAPAEGVLRELGDRTAVAALSAADALRPKRPLAVGGAERARLVTLRSSGLLLELVPYEPRRVHDRPRGTYATLEVTDERGPLALAVLERSGAGDAAGAGRWRASMVPYPIRPQRPAVVQEVGRVLATLADAADTSAGASAVRRVELAVRRAAPGALPPGVSVARQRDHRGGRLHEPPVTAVYAPVEPRALGRLYLRLEARLPPSEVEVPPLRTRFLDLWVEPGLDRAGARVEDDPAVKALIESAGASLWSALEGVGSLGEALEVGERTLAGLASPGLPLIACGRLLP